jgi:hypothetical protein
LSAIGIIDYHKLDYENVFIIALSYQCPKGKMKILNVNPIKGNLIQKIASQLQYLNYAKYFDQFITKITKSEDFIAFLPDMHLIGKLLVTNPHCKGFNFFEEGIASYVTYDNLNTLGYFFYNMPWRNNLFRIKDLGHFFRNLMYIVKGYNLKVLSLPRPANCYTSFKNVNFYGFCQDVFPNSAKTKKYILSFKQIRKYFSVSSNLSSLNNGYIWIGDHIMGQYSIDMYLNAINSSIIKDAKKNNISEIHIKFHHFDTEESNNLILQHFMKNGFNVIVVQKEIILEIELLDLINVSVYGIASSLLFYAALIGHKSYATYPLVNNPDHFDDNDFQYFKNKVTIIDNLDGDCSSSN